MLLFFLNVKKKNILNRNLCFIVINITYEEHIYNLISFLQWIIQIVPMLKSITPAILSQLLAMSWQESVGCVSYH